MYLQELRISNFRCFSEPQTIEFSKGINVLVGENDSGKSAIIILIKVPCSAAKLNMALFSFQSCLTDAHFVISV